MEAAQRPKHDDDPRRRAPLRARAGVVAVAPGGRRRGSGCRCRHHARGGFTLLELAVTVAALVIVLGLMVSMARDVRSRSSEDLTRSLLTRLERLAAEEVPAERRAALSAALKGVPPLVRPGESTMPAKDPPWLGARAQENSERAVAALQAALGVGGLDVLPLSLYDGKVVRDAWGTPVVYMPPHAANVNMRPQSRAFFMSAGPDRQFSTVHDNLYSYERPWDERPGRWGR